MSKDFAIVPIENIKVDAAYNAIQSVMSVQRIDISRHNRIAIGINEKIVFDISKQLIKGRILDSAGKHEANTVLSILKLLGTENVYIHFYGQQNFFKTNEKLKII